MEEKSVELAVQLTKYILQNRINIKTIDENEIIEYIKENSTNH